MVEVLRVKRLTLGDGRGLQIVSGRELVLFDRRGDCGQSAGGKGTVTRLTEFVRSCRMDFCCGECYRGLRFTHLGRLPVCSRIGDSIFLGI